MGEVAALAAAFEAETDKTLAALPAISLCPPSEHDAHLNHHRVGQRMVELIAYYSSRLPPYVCVHRILAIGDRLARQGEHRLALESCYQRVHGMAMHTQTHAARMDANARLSCHVQACYGMAACEAALALGADPWVKHPSTLQTLVACMQQLKDALAMVLPVEQLYWLTLNGTVHIYSLSKQLLTAGFVAQMLPFLLFCVRSLDQHVTFSTAKYLPWRTQLYSTLCYAYGDAGAFAAAKKVVQGGLASIDALIKLQKLDPVPAPPEIQAAYKKAKATLCALKLKLEVQSAPSGPPPAAPAPTEGKKGAAAAKDAAKDAAAADAGMAALQPLLAELAISPKFKLTVMAEALQVPGRRFVRHQPTYGLLKDMFEATRAEAAPFIAKLQEAIAAASSSQPGGGVGAEADAPAPDAGAFGEAPQLQAAAVINPPEAEEFSLLLHRTLLCTAYNFEQHDAFQELLSLAQQRLAVGAVGQADEGGVAVFSAVQRLLAAVDQMDKAPGAESLRHVSTTLAAVCPVAHQAVPDMLTDAALALHASARPLLEGVYCARDREAALVAHVLRTLHQCAEAVDLDDALLRVSHALKLALLLEEQAAMQGEEEGLGAGDALLYEARDVLVAARAAVTKFRCELNACTQGSPDEGLRWITASRSQPSDAAARLVAAMPDTDQELACLHTDVLAALFRVEMAVGVAEQRSQAQGKQTRLVEAIRKREAQSNIFGVRTMKEKRIDDVRITQAAATPANPPAKERELLQACGKNGYEKAIALMQMAPYQSEAHRQVAMLTEAADLLVKAQEREDLQFAAAQPERGKKTHAPLQPRVLQRTPTSCTLTNFPFNLKGGKRVARYAVYAKSFGAGVALILNKTASEYPGTGTQVVPGTRVTVEGLRSNDTYVFGIAAYDDQGQLISELGTSSHEMLAGLPLPLLHCWAHLLLTACKLRLWPLAKRAAGVLFPHFVATTPDRPLWEANPMSAQSLHQAHLEVAARPLLRAFTQGVYAYTGATLQAELAALQAKAAGGLTRGVPPPLAEVRAPYLSEQVARLKSVKRIMLAMHTAVVLQDEMLVEEGAVRCCQLLGPLLEVQDKTPLIHKALAHVYSCLQHVSNLIQDSQVGQERQRLAATRVACATTYYAVLLASKAGEGKAASALASLQLELLKAYDPRFSVPGRPPPAELLPDIAALQDGLLAHPRSKDWAAANPGSVLAVRMADEGDLAARALPLIAGPSPMEAWNTVLCREDSAQHPRWVELTTRTLEACLRAGHTEGLLPVAEQVRWTVREALQRPQLEFPGPKWDLESAVQALVASIPTLPADAEPPRPDLEGLSQEDKAAAEQQYAADKEAALLVYRRRVAAVTLLQRRLPALLARKLVIDKARELAAKWAPWRARLAAVLGLLEATKGREELAARMAAQILDLSEGDAAAGADSAPPPTSPGAKSGPPSPSKAGKPTSAKGGKSGGGAAAAADGGAAGAPGGPTGEASAALRALQQLARAAQLAARCGQWHEVLNASRHTWNAARALLNADSALMQPTPPLAWEQGQPMPAPPVAPPSLLQPAGGGKDAKGGKGAPPKKDDKGKAKPPSAKGGKKGAAADPSAPPERVWPPVPLPTNAHLNAGRVLRAAADALMDLVSALREGAQLCTGVLPIPPSTDPAGPGGDDPTGAVLGGNETGTGTSPKKATAGRSTAPRPGTQASAAYASSAFSYGSDLQVDLWFTHSALSMQWVNKYVCTILTVLLRMQRNHAVVALGTTWLKLCEGHFNETVLPMLLAAAPAAGMDCAPFQAAMEVVVRDKNAALDALDKVRRLVREKLGEVTPLNEPLSTKVKKKRRAQGNSGRPGTAQSLQSTGTANDNSSVVSAYTYQTQSSLKGGSGAQNPDFIRMPQEYEKAIEVLKKRGEKGALILATTEMGDVHAHFGNWGAAISTWHDALDTLLGPYQVLKGWRKVLDPLSERAIIQQYGVHGCLLAGGILLGKLARYAYFAQLGMRLEACRMAATLLRAIFCCDVVHPQRQVGFATYVPRELWQGVDVFSDPYRCNMTDLLSGLETVCCTLVDAGLALEALPVLALWEHVAWLVTRNLQATVLCRIVRAHALVQLGLLREAAGLLVDLMQGSRLPDPTLDSDLVVKDEQGAPLQGALIPPFNSAAYPGDPDNKPSVSLISEGPFPPTLSALYGPWAVARLALARAAFLQALGHMPNLWSATHFATGQKVAPGGAPAPAAVEPALMERALGLVARAKAMATGAALEPETGPAPAGGAAGGKGAGGKAAAGKDAKPAGKDKKDDKKGDANGQAPPPPPSSPAVEAQRAEVMVRALLLESQLEVHRLRPQLGLNAVLEALRFMGQRGDSSTLNIPLGDNDDTERFSLGAGLWLQARLQAATCLLQLRNVQPCHAMLSQGLQDAAQVQDGRVEAALLHLRGNLHQLSGETAKALETYSDVVARLQALQVADPRLARALADAALLRDQLGLREDAARLFGAALGVARAWAFGLGLCEAREHTELVNVYSVGTLLYAQLLERCAVCAMRQRQLGQAVALLEEALSLLQRQSRALPGHHATTSLLLGRALRLTMVMPDGPSANGAATNGGGGTSSGGAVGGTTRALEKDSIRSASPSVVLGASAGGAGAKVAVEAAAAVREQLQRVQSLLSGAFVLAALDGGHLRDIMRAALLELALLHVAGSSAAQAAACLRHAQVVSTRRDALLLATHTLAPVAVAQVPEWAREFVRDQELAFGKGAAPSDADLGRLIMCHFVTLTRALPTLPSAEAQRAQSSLATLHAALRAACPKYASDACVAADAVVLPPPADGADTAQLLAPGTVLLQWLVQDGCPQEPRSWQSHGALLSGANALPPSDSDVLALEPVETYASLVYVVVLHSGKVCVGERTFKLQTVRNLQQQVRLLRHRCETPKGATDLFGHVAPSDQELRVLRRASEFFFAGRRLSEDGAASSSLLNAGLDADVASAETASIPPGTPPVPSTPPPGAKGGAKPGGKPGAPAAGAPATPPGQPPPTDLAFLIKLEAALNVDGGLDLADDGFAQFIALALGEA